MESSSARALTGGIFSSRPRPEGLSGWQITSETSAISLRALRAGTAMAGVPKKMARTAGSLSVLFGRAELGVDRPWSTLGGWLG